MSDIKWQSGYALLRHVHCIPLAEPSINIPSMKSLKSDISLDNTKIKRNESKLL